MTKQPTNLMYSIIHFSLWICEMLNRMMILILILNNYQFGYVSILLTYFVLEKTFNICRFIRKFSFLEAIKKIVKDLLNLNNILQYFIENKFHFSNHPQITIRTAVNILSIQYFLFYKREFYQIENQFIQSLFLFVIMLNYILPAILNCMICSTVNDLLFTTNHKQVFFLAIQSIPLLLLESIILTQGQEQIAIYYLIKVVVTVTQIIYAVKKNLSINYLTQKYEVITGIIVFSLLSVPYNYMPFIDYISKSYCIRDKQQFHDIFLKFGRLTQFLQYLLGFFIFTKCDSKSLLIIKKFYFLQLFIFISIIYALFNLIYILNTLYCNITENYTYLFKPVIKIDELIRVINKSKDILFLEVSRIEGISIVQGVQIDDRQTVLQNINNNLTSEQKYTIFNQLFRKHPKNSDFKLYIGNLIQIYQSSTAYYSYTFFDLLINAIENREELTIRYLINKDFISIQQTKRYFLAILNRMFKFGYSSQINNLNKTSNFNKKPIEITYQFQSQMAQTLLFHKIFPSLIPMNPQQLYYDLFEDL